MNAASLPREHPVPTVVTVAFALVLALTIAYFAGLIPGVPKILPTFVDLVTVTGGLFAAAALAWAVSLLTRSPGSDR